MALGLIGLKVGMTQIYDETGKIAPVTVLQIGPCPVLQVRNQERDGYDALQLGYLDKARRKAIRAERGHVSDALGSKRRAAALPPAWLFRLSRTVSRSGSSASSVSIKRRTRRSAPF